VSLAEPETAESHAAKPIKTIAITPTRLAPQDLRMGTGDVLSFQNLSLKMMQLTFIEPKNVGQKTTCSQLKRVSPDEATAPGAVFQRQGDQVTALIAPGTFVSICSLMPGTYVYTANAAFEGALPDESLGMKGTITVE
jgi:plastocyanin